MSSGASICGEDWGTQTPVFDPPFLLHFAFPPPPLPLKVGPLKCSQGVRGSAMSSPNGVWGGAPAEIDFFYIFTPKI